MSVFMKKQSSNQRFLPLIRAIYIDISIVMTLQRLKRYRFLLKSITAPAARKNIVVGSGVVSTKATSSGLGVLG